MDKLLFDTTQLQEIECWEAQAEVQVICKRSHQCPISLFRVSKQNSANMENQYKQERKAWNPLLFKPIYDQIAKISNTGNTDRDGQSKHTDMCQ